MRVTKSTFTEFLIFDEIVHEKSRAIAEQSTKPLWL
jgi:hypothetical protein